MNKIQAPTRYVDKDNREIQIVSRSDTHVSLCPRGGGRQYTMTSAEFDTHFKPATDEPRSRERIKVSFGWADGGLTFEAFSNGQRWNGWAIPSFTKEVGLALCDAIPDLVYDEETDRFVDKDEDSAPDYNSWGSEGILVDGRPVIVYDIGAGFWCWHQESDLEKAPAPRPA